MYILRMRRLLGWEMIRIQKITHNKSNLSKRLKRAIPVLKNHH